MAQNYVDYICKNCFYDYKTCDKRIIEKKILCQNDYHGNCTVVKCINFIKRTNNLEEE